MNAYHINWGVYREKPYTYEAKDLRNIVAKLDELYYFIAYFCPPLDSTKIRPYWADLYCKEK